MTFVDETVTLTLATRRNVVPTEERSMFKTSTKEAHFASVPLFSKLDRKQMAALLRHVDEQSLVAGTVIMKQGATAFEACVLLDGTVTIERDGQLLETAGPGRSFGELAMLDKRPRSATVTAQTDVLVGVIGPRDFDAALEEVPGLAKALLVDMAGRLRAMDERLAAAGVN
jgi:CRP/FNR family transcriptional regulator, cyclic AMP receptor protein